MSQSKLLDPIHPGEILLEEFMKPLGISINQLARDLDVPPNRISAIVNGARSITADTALRLGAYFRMSAETWLGLQLDYDLRLTRRLHGSEILTRVRPGRHSPVTGEGGPGRHSPVRGEGGTRPAA